MVHAQSGYTIDDFSFSFLALDIEEDFELSDEGDHFDDIGLFGEGLLSFRKSFELVSFSTMQAETHR